MNPFSFSQLVILTITIISFPQSLGGVDAYAMSQQGREMVYNWTSITTYTDLNWTPCFDNYTCARLEVPLDYSNASLGTTSIAFMKLLALDAQESTQNILLNGGGPGVSGIEYLFSSGPLFRQIFGSQYNLVGFDTRGINNSGPIVNCFQANPDARTTYEGLFFSEVSNASSTSLETQFYSADLFGEWCSETIGQRNGSEIYISTPLVAQDMLSYAKAEQRAAGKPESDAAVWYYGASYGTALGATFASLFPNNVGRLILDGVIDAEDYYQNGWRANLFQADEALNTFSTFCHQSGPNNCSFWGPSPQNITNRLDNILAELKYHPIPKTGLDGTSAPGLATYSDLKQLMLLAVYFPLPEFPLLADILSGLENGNASLFLTLSDLIPEFLYPSDGDDADILIKCIDGYGRTNYTTIEDYEMYVDLLDSQSKYFGEVWPNNAAGVLCRSLNLQIPDSVMFQGSLPPSSNKTAFPILFVSNTIDPVAPIRGAQKMSNAFPGSVVLAQDGIGHTASFNGGSTCLFNYFQDYLSGNLPPANTTCEQEFLPFRDPGNYNPIP